MHLAVLRGLICPHFVLPSSNNKQSLILDDCRRTMDLLQAYDSSPCSSPSSSPPKAHTSSRGVNNNDNHVSLLSCGKQTTLPIGASDGSSGVGSGDNNTSGEADTDGRGRNATDARAVSVKCIISSANSSNANEQQSIANHNPRVLIAGYNFDVNTNGLFERSQPHWEGRWTGHLHLPFPSIETLDEVDVDDSDESIDGIDDVAIPFNSRKRKLEVEESAYNQVRDSSFKSDDSDSESSDEDEMPQSHLFLPTARQLIQYWAKLIEESYKKKYDATKDSCKGDILDKTQIVIVPHIPMHSKKKKSTTETKQFASKEAHPELKQSVSSLHISLARPIYLPAPSVDSFLADIAKVIGNVVSISKSHNNVTRHDGKIFQLQPHNATIFTNDEQTRSFLTIPVSTDSSRWVKRVLLPPIDAAMSRFGLQSYYSTDEGGCVLHVSIASIKGNMVKHLMRDSAKRTGDGSARDGAEDEVRSLPLFTNLHTHKTHEQVELTRNIPTFIPIRLNRVRCQFGKVKEVVVPF